jgi:hypothetical protein
MPSLDRKKIRGKQSDREPRTLNPPNAGKPNPLLAFGQFRSRAAASMIPWGGCHAGRRAWIRRSRGEAEI